MTTLDVQQVRTTAPELYGDFWFNSEPVLLSSLRGRAALVVFWDYTSRSCEHVLLYVGEWHRKYMEFGFVVVAVHTPRFPFGKNPACVQEAIDRLRIEFPVVMDNESLVWSRYGTRVWPTVYLIDGSGHIRHQNTGEGNYHATEHAVQSMLYESGIGEELPVIMQPLREADRPGAVCYRSTPELFAGYLRGSIGNVEGCVPESAIDYEDPQIYFQGRFYADGTWLNERDSLRFAGAGSNRSGQIILNYQGCEANAVMDPDSGSLEVTVKQDNQYLTDENKGEDVRIDEDGRSFVLVDSPRLYHVARNREYGEHNLRLAAATSGWAMYSLSFVSDVIPEPVSNN